MNTRSSEKLDQWIVAVLFAVLSIVVLYIYVTVAEPPERKPGAEFARNYSDAPLTAALTTAELQRNLAQIQAASQPAGAKQVGRLPGSPGCVATANLIEDAFRKAKLTVVKQAFPVAVPHTEYCELLDAQGKPLPDVTLYPFEPSGMLPNAQAAKGLSGPLVVTQSTQPLDLVGKPLKDSIVLNQRLTADWPTLASLGVKAVIVQENAMEKPADADAPMPWDKMLTPYDIPYPRYLARGPLEKYAHQRLTIRCKVVWTTVQTTNLIGVLHGGQSARADHKEALVITSNYDSNSQIPDLAPGGEQAISPAALMALVRAFVPYQGKLQRDIIFIATSARGQCWTGATHLLEAITTSANPTDPNSLARRKADAEQKLAFANHALEIINDPTPWKVQDNTAYRAAWQREDPVFRKWFEKCFPIVAGEVNLRLREQYLQARLQWIRAGRPAFRAGFDALHASEKERALPENRDPLMAKYIEEKQYDTDAGDVLSLPFWQVAAQLSAIDPESRPHFAMWGYQKALKQYFKQVVEYHNNQVNALNDSLAVHEVFAPYTATFTVSLELFSGGHTQAKNLSVLAGVWNPGTTVEPQSTDLKNTLADYLPLSANKIDPTFTVTNWGTADAMATKADPNIHGTNLETQVWHRAGRPAFTITDKNFLPGKLGTPEDTFDQVNLAVVSEQMPVIGKALLAIAHGRITMKEQLQNTANYCIFSFQGKALTSVGTSALVPTHPLGGQTFVHIFAPNAGAKALANSGIHSDLIVQTNPYGEYVLPYVFYPGGQWARMDIDAARFGDNGQVTYFKASKQGVFTTTNIPSAQLALGSGGNKQVNLPLFRGTQVVCYQRVNPSTFNLFPRFDFLVSQGLTEPDDIHLEDTINSPAISAFLPPDCIFDIAMMDGSAANPNIQSYRAFMLHVDNQHLPEVPTADEPELFGNGYLAADFPNLTFPYLDGAASMLRTNAKRLRLQNQYHMADPQMNDAQAHGELMLAEAHQLLDKGDPFSAMNAAGNALSSAINNHPVIRDKISNAVFGILWYLALLVPFVFFFEKLIFGFTDVRTQLLAVGVIFVVVFTLLQFFHPAFRMVSSPMIILLGFLILLLSIIVTVMVSGKFQQTIAELRRKEGHVEGADINRGGVVGTAFMLGLNNMRRRQVRTGLTCVTLVLITFVMICFTSVTTNVSSVEYVTGHAPSNGILRRDPNFTPISSSELTNITQNYGLLYPVATQTWLVSNPDLPVKTNTELLIDREYLVGTQKISKRGKANAALTLQWNEPMFSGIDSYLITHKGWFPRPPETSEELAKAAATGYKPCNYVILPDTMAAEIGLTPKDVDSGHPTVLIRGEEYEVQGIIDALKLDKHVGMDGASILPYDQNAMQNAGHSSGAGGGSPQDVARLKASQVIITSKAPVVQVSSGQPLEQNIAVSCAVLFPNAPYQLHTNLPALPAVPYKEQHQVVNDYLERLGIGAYYAINNIAYYGTRTRERSMAGLIELLIPILIAAMTVFNTMRGSVYERREEIYVYNAVGIAPNHIFFMFMAEACVYAVIGAMAGYLLSQVVGTALTAMHLTGGLNMDYSSIETIYASLAIVASVMLSTLVPAHTASRLALPSDEASWTVPKADGDVMQFNLPFTFTAHDRVAVISYFYRWLDANGEGSSGSFFCAPPTLQLDDLARDVQGIVPGIAATVWLKPYDLGVSQRVTISLPTDPETGEFIASIRIERLSGTISAWNRAVMPFLSALRKQFLNWRAVSDTERAEMFTESKTLLTPLTTEDREAVNA